MKEMEPLFKPRSVAVVGASRHPGKIGYAVVKNLIASKYEGKIYPVNPKADEILGLKAYPTVSSIPGEVDMVVVVVPAQFVPEVIEDAGKKGAKVAVIITSGFKEIGRADLEEEVVRRARKYGMRVLGPNIFGIVYTPVKLNATFGPSDVIEGSVGFITQSGALGIALMGMTIVEKIGVSTIVSIGNKSDIDDADLLNYLKDDEETKVVLIYLEGVTDGKKFMEAAQNFTLRKPLIVIKAGKTAAGAKAVASHTGSLAGNVAVYSTLFKETGILEASTVEEAFDWARAFSYLPQYEGGQLVIVTNGGGAGVLATDVLAENGISLKTPPEPLVNELRPKLPGFASLKNPIDVTGMISSEGYVEAVSAALRSEGVGAVLALYCETAVTNPEDIAEGLIKEVNEMGGLKKPLTVALIGGRKSYNAVEMLNNARIPAYPMPERAASAMAAVINYVEARERVRLRLQELGNS
ncbi:MAG: CoA-binding protein [Desulfurococcales archaeon]|nr:CoA-binding protein [Desulfurococcales archaeon]